MMKRNGTWVAMAQVLLGELTVLLGKRAAAQFRREISLLLERADAGENVDAGIRRLLGSRAETREWAERFLAPRAIRWPGAILERSVESADAYLGGSEVKAASIVVPVYYGTDRARTKSSDPAEFYGNERGELRFGTALVSIPHDHRMGELESPKWWKLELRPDPARHVVLLRVEPTDERDWTARVAAAAGRAPAQDALVFIHGYNVSFADAARRAAQIAYDLAFAGPPLLYSWPSTGEAISYRRDENNVRWTVPHFIRFLDLVLTRTGTRAVHVIAHSMGNRALTEALRTFQATTLPAGAATLSQVIFAAPDVDAATFQDMAREFHQAARRFTLYASSRDKALLASKTFNRYPRAGGVGPEMVLTDGVDTIDASLVDTTLTGHSYIGDNDSILGDVYDLLRDGQPPDGRAFRLRARERGGHKYWQFRPLRG